jgi:hypothetical protein
MTIPGFLCVPPSCAGAEAYRSLWSKMVKNAAHVACAALNEVRQENTRQKVPPSGTFEVSRFAWTRQGAGGRCHLQLKQW